MNYVVNDAQSKIPSDQLIMNESFADEFVCKLCNNVVGCGPQLTKCSHLLCGDCFQEWFDARPNSLAKTQGKAGSVAPCPVCRTLLRKEQDIYPVEKCGKAASAFVWRMLQGLKIKCNAMGGCCSWKGEYGSYFEHLQCGDCLAEEPDKVDSAEVDECSTAYDEPANEWPPSPSTCSDVVNAHALEELNTDCSHDGCSLDERSDAENASTSDSLCYQDPEAEDLNSLIKNMIKVTTRRNPEVPLAVDKAQPNMLPSKLAKARIGGSKKQHAKDSHTTSTKNKTMAPEALRAYQWQVAASYQMAYAQQYRYHMAIQSARMQQYYHQMRMASGVSM